MATYFASTPLVSASGSNQIATIGNIRNAFLSCSFIRTVQSGSVDDLSTLPSASQADVVRTYDIFAFNDGLQATSPLFIKIQYLTGPSSTPGSFRYNYQMGTAHDSSGSLTGVSTLTTIANTANSNTTLATNQPVYASGDGSYMTLAAYSDNSFVAQLSVFERFYDSSGNITGSGFHMVGTNANETNKAIYAQACYAGQTPPTRDTVAIPCTKPSRVPSTYNGVLLLGTVYPFIGKPLNPSPNILIGDSTTFPTAYATANYTMYGVNRTYRVLTSAFNQTNSQVFANSRFLLRYE